MHGCQKWCILYTREAGVALGYASSNSYASLMLSKIPACTHILGLYFLKGLFWLAYFLGSVLFSEGLIIGRNFAFQNGLCLAIKTA